jgi:hypothetical protein
MSFGPACLDTVIVYDSSTNDTVTYFDVSSDLNKYCKNSFDEGKPHSILLRQGPSTGCKIVSYDYINRKAQIESFISKAVEDTEARNCHHIFNAKLGTRGILSRTFP